MRMAITNRRGRDTSNLTLRIEQTAHDQLPPIGTEVWAYGDVGWSYYGKVIGHNADEIHYTVQVLSVSNKWLDNIKQWNGAAVEPPQG